MNIKKISKRTELSSHTLRYYEKIGLILNIKRDSKGHRDYSEQDVKWIEFIKRLKATDMPLNDIKIFAELRYEGDRTVDQRLKLLEKHKLRIDAQIKNMRVHQKKIDTKIELYKNWDHSKK